MRTATEFENLCKYSLKRNSFPIPCNRNLNVIDYKDLEPIWKLEDKEVGVLFWLPNVKYIQPFDKWSSSSPTLGWYQAYNNVKHNREANFPKASLKNVTLAIGGLFLALEAEFDEDVFNPFEASSPMHGHGTQHYSEKHINNSVFTIRIRK